EIVEHPGTPVMVLESLVIRGVNLFDRSAYLSLDEKVLTKPELYLEVTHQVFIFAIFLALLILGFLTYAYTKDFLLSLLILASPFISKTVIVFGLTRVSPEPMLLLSSLLMVVVLMLYLYKNGEENNESMPKSNMLFIFLFSLVSG